MTIWFAEAKGWRKQDFLHYLSQRYGGVEKGRGFKGNTSDRYFEIYYVEYDNDFFEVTLVGNEFDFTHFDYLATYYFFANLDLSGEENGFVEEFNEAMEIAEFKGGDLPCLYASCSVSRVSKLLNASFLDMFFDAWETDLLFALFVLKDSKLYGDTNLIFSLAAVMKAKYVRRSQFKLSRSRSQSDGLQTDLIKALRTDVATCPRCGGSGRQRLQFRQCGDCSGTGETRGLTELSRSRIAVR